MPDIDLGPNDYRKRDLETGRLRALDDPKLARNMLAISVAVLLFIFCNRGQFSAGTPFGVSALFAFCAGIMLALWQKNRYF